MLKFFVIIWLSKMIVDLMFGNGFLLNNILKRGVNYIPKDFTSDDMKQADISSLDENVISMVFKSLLYSLYTIIFTIVDIILMIIMLKYDNTYITLIFIIYSFVYTLYGIIKKPKDKDDNFYSAISRTINKLSARPFKKTIVELLNVIYWSYAFWLVFVK